MAINKVEYGGRVLVDLTADSVEADALVVGHTAHGKDGEPVEGANPYELEATNAEVQTQTDLIGQIAAVLEGKAAGGGGGGSFVEGTLAIAAEVSELDVPVGFVPDIFIATVTDMTATSGMKTLTWIRSDSFDLVDIQNMSTLAHSFKAEDYTEDTESGIKVKRYGSYNIPVGTLRYQAYKRSPA